MEFYYLNNLIKLILGYYVIINISFLIIIQQRNVNNEAKSVTL